MSGVKRITQLDGLRAIAVLMVFGSHAYSTPLLWSGVDLFFILSGFLITGILLEQREQRSMTSYLASFYLKRTHRIIPAYLVFLAFSSIFIGISWITHWYLFLFLMNSDLFRKFDDHNTFGVLWSLAVEEQFYVLWPIAVYLLSETALAWLAGSLVLIAPLLRWTATVFFPLRWPIHTSTPFRMDLLAVGALIAFAWRHRRTEVERFGPYGLLVLGVAVTPLLLFSRYPWFQPSANTVLVNVWLYELILIAWVGVVLWALSGRHVEMLRIRSLVYIGVISYSFYLVHFTLISVVRHHVRHYSVGIALGASLLYATISWFLIEHPILRARLLVR
jgi:peptidoglycan/LPS O-acetylase OafA/YrhL